MVLRETYATLKAAKSGQVVFILDASESATQARSAIISLVQEVLTVLPAGAVQALHFLGTPVAYPLQHFASRAAQWFMENRRRASLLTPLLETFSHDDSSTIVVIGSGTIFDLEDWVDTPLAQHLLLVSLNESLQETPEGVEEIAHPTAQELQMRLDDPMTRVEIAGSAFMPTWWDNPAYRCQLVNGAASLIAERCEDYSLTVRFLARQEGTVQAMVTHASGTQSTELLTLIEATQFQEPTTGQLTAREQAIFRQAVKREPFSCVHCGQRHPWQTLRCLEGAIILGELVYPSLQSQHAAGFVIFRSIEDEVRFETHPCSVLPLGTEEVAIKEGQRAVVYRFDGQAGWVRTERVLEPYQPIGEQRYAVLL
jgi:hypothetical protein